MMSWRICKCQRWNPTNNFLVLLQTQSLYIFIPHSIIPITNQYHSINITKYNVTSSRTSLSLSPIVSGRWLCPEGGYGRETHSTRRPRCTEHIPRPIIKRQPHARLRGMRVCKAQAARSFQPISGLIISIGFRPVHTIAELGEHECWPRA